MKFDFEIDESLKRERNEKIEKLYTDPLVQQFLKKNDLNHDFLTSIFLISKILLLRLRPKLIDKLGLLLHR